MSVDHNEDRDGFLSPLAFFRVCFFSPPLPVSPPPRAIVYSVCTWAAGYREFMEDSETIELSLPNHPNTGFFAVFDGHSGEVTGKILLYFAVGGELLRG